MQSIVAQGQPRLKIVNVVQVSMSLQQNKGNVELCMKTKLFSVIRRAKVTKSIYCKSLGISEKLLRLDEFYFEHLDGKV